MSVPIIYGQYQLSGFDPEASMGADSDAAGVDRGVYPSSKSFLVGLDISFLMII